MSHWQHKNSRKRHLLLLKLSGFCFFLHCAVLLWVFFIHNNGSYNVSLSLHKHLDYSSPILFVPLSCPTMVQPLSTSPEVTASPILKKESPPTQKEESQKTNTTTLATQKKELPQKPTPVVTQNKKNALNPTIPTPKAVIKKETPTNQPIVK